MNSADKSRRSLVYADGYSYTEILQLPDQPDMPSGHRLIRVFHPLFSDDVLASDLAPERPADPVEMPNEVA